MLRRIDRFFFGPDNAAWDLVRFGAGLSIVLAWVLLGLSGNYERLYGHYGMLPRAEAMDAVYWPAYVFLMKSDPMWIWRIYWATMAAAFCLAIGFQTRIAAIATFFLYVATIQRNLTSYNGEAGILGVVLVSLIFAPTPQHWSVDHLWLRKPLPMQTERWPARFLQINICFMYLFTTIGKLVGQWDFGTGEIWYNITLCDWFRFPNAEWLRTRPMCWMAVHGSLAIEGSFAFLVWTRLRLPLVLLLMAMHVAIIVLFCNALLFFNLAAITALSAFLRREDLQAARRFLGRCRRKVAVAPATESAAPTETVATL